MSRVILLGGWNEACRDTARSGHKDLMRVTAQTKAATRRKILDVAQRLFAEKGYAATATRDIARAAGIASGTLFNYFPTKEAVLACLAGDAMAEALADAPPNQHNAETLEEGLFALVAAGLRRMKPGRAR